MNFGLTEITIHKICAVLARYPQVEEAILYGSRAKGNYKRGSDIDLTLHGADLTLRLLYKIMDELDELLLPYTMDVSLYANISDAEVRAHIERVGVVFYRKSAAEAALLKQN